MATVVNMSFIIAIKFSIKCSILVIEIKPKGKRIK